MFTSTPLTGNGLAVVHDADGVDDATMLAYARETQLSETTFVQSGDAEADYRNRIWMTLGELPFAGHPSLGTAVAVAHLRGQSGVRYVQRTVAGLQPVEVELDGLLARASMLQEPPGFGAEPPAAEVAGAVGLAPDDLVGELPPQVVATGVPQLLVPVADTTVLARAGGDAAGLAALLERTGSVCAFLAAWDPAGGTVAARSFFLSPGPRVSEDPATGSAAGPLMAYLHQRTGATALAIDQGVQMGRPSRLDASWEDDRPRVGGGTVIVSMGTLHL